MKRAVADELSSDNGDVSLLLHCDSWVSASSLATCG